MKVFIEIKDESFVHNEFIRYLHMEIVQNYNKIKYSFPCRKMDDYLKSHYATDVENIVYNFPLFIKIYKFGQGYILTIDEALKNGDVLYSTLISLIDNGNMQIKGLHLFDTSLIYVYNRRKRIYHLYVKGVSVVGNKIL